MLLTRWHSIFRLISPNGGWLIGHMEIEGHSETALKGGVVSYEGEA
jgi:hypothetical protein